MSSPSVGSATGRHAREAHGQLTRKSTSSFSLLRALFGSFRKIPDGAVPVRVTLTHGRSQARVVRASPAHLLDGGERFRQADGGFPATGCPAVSWASAPGIRARGTGASGDGGRTGPVHASREARQYPGSGLRRAAANLIVVGETKEVLMMRSVARVIQAGTCDVQMVVPRLVIGRSRL